MRPKILIFVEWYLPGYNAGGLITVVANLVEFLGDTFEFFVITRDRDLTDEQPYPHTRCDEWVSVGKAHVFYTADFSLRHLRRRVLEVAPDIMYLNSFFSVLTVKTLSLRRFGLLPTCPIVLAPQGEFSPGALDLNGRRKWLYRNLAFRGGLCSGVVWQAGSDIEREHIDLTLRTGGVKHACIRLAWELPSRDWLRTTRGPAKPAKTPNAARFLFLSRISPKKNLLYALDVLRELRGQVTFDICGPIDDSTYWAECKKRIESFRGDVVVRYRGAIPHDSVLQVAAEYHFSILPTLGENFGYVILEVMAAGCPVILSDQTPWRNVADRGAGWCLPLENRESWRRVLQQCVDMEQQTYTTFSQHAQEFVEGWVTSTDRQDELVRLFDFALGGTNCSDGGQR
jgi:glycosyltransferase involved in cell wall biosynthesis